MTDSVKPKKFLGQHFLKDLDIARRIADTVGDYKDIPILEIGPGMGVLTQYLIQNNHDLIVVELDSESVRYLSEHFPQLNGRILEQDFLKLDLTNAVFGMYAMNLLIPRVGEVWRCTYLARREKMSFTQVLGSIISERLCDTLTLVFLTVITFFLQMKVFRDFLRKFPTIEETLWRMITTPWLYICLLVMVGFLIWLFAKKTENRWVAKVKSIVKNLWYGFRTILRMKQVTMFLLYTVAIWFCYFLELYVCFFAFGSMQHLGVLAAMTLFVMGSLSMGIPVQGGVGPWHLAIIAALSIYGIGENIAGAFALVAHGSQMLLIILLGIYTLFSVSLEKKKDRSAGLADFVGSRRENDNY